MTAHPDEKEDVEAEEQVKQKEEAKNIRAAIDTHHKKWYDNLAFFIISLVLATVTFIGGYFVRMVDYIWVYKTNSWIYLGTLRGGYSLSMSVISDSIIQTLVFIASVGFFVLPLSWLFNKLWKLFLKE